MTNEQTAKAIYEAFHEGFDSYLSPDTSEFSAEMAWARSSAKKMHDEILGLGKLTASAKK